jgi:hypothetical protein
MSQGLKPRWVVDWNARAEARAYLRSNGKCNSKGKGNSNGNKGNSGSYGFGKSLRRSSSYAWWRSCYPTHDDKAVMNGSPALSSGNDDAFAALTYLNRQLSR